MYYLCVSCEGRHVWKDGRNLHYRSQSEYLHQSTCYYHWLSYASDTQSYQSSPGQLHVRAVGKRYKTPNMAESKSIDMAKVCGMFQWPIQEAHVFCFNKHQTYCDENKEQYEKLPVTKNQTQCPWLEAVLWLLSYDQQSNHQSHVVLTATLLTCVLIQKANVLTHLYKLKM